jgi:predicted small lipoprotein YifL
MKAKFMVLLLASILFALAACGSQPAPVQQAPAAEQAPPAQTEPGRAAEGEGMKIAALDSVIVDWSNRDSGQAAQPEWITEFVVYNNADAVTETFRLDPTAYVYFYSTKHRNLESARFDAQQFGAQKLAQEFKTYVMRAASRTMEQEQVNRLEEITTATKVSVAGNRQLADFWRRVRTNDGGRRTEEYIYYIFWSMDRTVYNQILRKYVNEIIGQLPDTNEKRNIAQAYADIEKEANTREQRDEAQFQQQLQLQLKAAEDDQERQMAKINQQTAQAQAEARYDAYKNGTTAAAAAASTTAADFDWISALASDVGLIAKKIIF